MSAIHFSIVKVCRTQIKACDGQTTGRGVNALRVRKDFGISDCQHTAEIVIDAIGVRIGCECCSADGCIGDIGITGNCENRFYITTRRSCSRNGLIHGNLAGTHNALGRPLRTGIRCAIKDHELSLGALVRCCDGVNALIPSQLLLGSLAEDTPLRRGQRATPVGFLIKVKIDHWGTCLSPLIR